MDKDKKLIIILLKNKWSSTIDRRGGPNSQKIILEDRPILLAENARVFRFLC